MPRIKSRPTRFAGNLRYQALRRRLAATRIQRGFRRYRTYKTARMSMNRSLGTNLSRRIGRYL